MKRYSVYIHQNKINGKLYIGITSQKPENRWRKGNGYKGCVYFYKAINKYGWKNFKHTIVKSGLPEECAKTFEKVLIKLYHTQDPDFGYNITPGGDTHKTWTPVESIKDKSSPNKYVRMLDWDDNVVRTFRTVREAADYINGDYSGVYRHLNKDIPYMNYFFETVQ